MIQKMSIQNRDFSLLRCIRFLNILTHGIYFSCFFCMSFQNSGQNTFVALNCPRRAVFFSLFRKVVLVVPLTLLFPLFLGVEGVFYAEAFSQAVGGTLCCLTMLMTVYRKVRNTPDGVKAEI